MLIILFANASDNNAPTSILLTSSSLFDMLIICVASAAKPINWPIGSNLLYVCQVSPILIEYGFQPLRNHASLLSALGGCSPVICPVLDNPTKVIAIILPLAILALAIAASGPPAFIVFLIFVLNNPKGVLSAVNLAIFAGVLTKGITNFKRGWLWLKSCKLLPAVSNILPVSPNLLVNVW